MISTWIDSTCVADGTKTTVKTAPDKIASFSKKSHSAFIKQVNTDQLTIAITQKISILYAESAGVGLFSRSAIRMTMLLTDGSSPNDAKLAGGRNGRHNSPAGFRFTT